MKKRVMALFLSVALPAILLGAAPSGAAEPGGPERSMGSADAPITMVEYSSLSCSHCARFHREVLPELKRLYIDTGQVRLVYRHFSLNGIAKRAALLAECVPERRYFRFIDYLFKHQQSWAGSTGSVTTLKRIGQLAGLSTRKIKRCLSDNAVAEHIEQQKQTAAREFSVSSTPTFIFNGNREIRGARSLAVFENLLNELLDELPESGE